MATCTTGIRGRGDWRKGGGRLEIPGGGKAGEIALGTAGGHWARWGAATGFTMQGRAPFFLDKESYTSRQRHAIMLKFGRQLLRDGYAESTVGGYIDGVIALHREVHEQDVVGTERSWRQWRRRLRAAGKRAPNRAHAAPKALLREAVRKGRRGELDEGVVAAMVVAFFGALRRSEYTARSGKKTRRLQLRWRRVVFFTEEYERCEAWDERCAGVTVKIYRKMDGGAYGQWIPFFPSGDADVCPFGALRAMAQRSGCPKNGAVFTTREGGLVSGDAVNRAVKACADGVGMSSRHLSTHSLRRGGSVAMQAAELGDELRREFCAWRSSTHQVYKDPLASRCKDVARRMWGAEPKSMGLRH